MDIITNNTKVFFPFVPSTMTTFVLPRQARRAQPKPHFLHTLFLSFLFLLPSSTNAREADERSRFLYAGDHSAQGIILEYQLHMAPSADYSGDEREEAAKRPPGAESEVEATKHVKPYFLVDGYDGMRVVEFYSPWCGHCQKFKPRYISLAKEVKSRTLDHEVEVEFHAVSCSAHHWVCKDNGIKGYPTVRTYRAGSKEGTKLERFTAETIADALGLPLTKGVGAVGTAQAGDKVKLESASVIEYADPLSQRASIDILGATRDIHKRTRIDVYNDAALSFTHALKSGVFPHNAPGITTHEGIAGLLPAQKDAFAEWIDLLYWTLPPTWKLHTLINDIRTNMEEALSSHDNLSRIVENHHEVVNDNSDKWSDACSKGRDGAGYTCGLWSLFHIMSVGVSERHSAVLGARDRVSTQHAAETLRDYITNFFGCTVCQRNFLTMYNECGYNHCNRFKPRERNPPQESWEEFALWVWEMHNGVNEQLLNEDFQRKHGRMATEMELESVRWPSRTSCGPCYGKDHQWDREKVTSYLKMEYWPGGVQNFRFVVLDKSRKTAKDDTFRRDGAYKIIVPLVSVLLSVSAWAWKRFRLATTGRHKKFENDFV